MEEAKKDGKWWLFAQIVVISRFTKNLDSHPVNSLKRNTEVFLLPWRKVQIINNLPKTWMW